jgi:hypothetical protein
MRILAVACNARKSFLDELFCYKTDGDGPLSDVRAEGTVTHVTGNNREGDAHRACRRGGRARWRSAGDDVNARETIKVMIAF